MVETGSDFLSGDLISASLTPFNAPVFTKALILLTINEVVAGAGIEPATQGFSVLCSTN